MEMNGELVSAVIPIKNEAKRVNTIVEGLYRQTYRPIEVVFVDGGSTDGTIEVIRETMERYSTNDFIVRLLREGDFGELRSPANARNIGVINARGVYVCFFDADFDLRSDPEAIGKVVGAFKGGADHVAIKYIPSEHTWIERNLALDDIVYYFNYDKPRHEVCCFTREVVLGNLFDPALGFGEDMEFLHRLSKLGIKRAVVDTTVRRCYPHSIRDFLRQQLWYGRTWLRYARKACVNRPLSIARSNAVLVLTTLSLALIALNLYVVSALAILLTMVLIYYRWLRRDIKAGLGVLMIPSRLLWLILREVVGRLFFDLGVLQSLIRRKAPIGRD
jgi:glycosyltransferase involved in cell wall biosynthesis